ncbi:hypothetical protein HMPREF0970_01597 [Schaalia odontolytica F0309]|uniref:Uncharacterized protein n=1 Tax=Schaalia odontolytica F0309 TaxID=649742 RepID=D4U061_9ACTO|nr:hypothetical protein HMPREF0970_01597 [Schaalia odontolytica F0309]
MIGPQVRQHRRVMARSWVLLLGGRSSLTQPLCAQSPHLCKTLNK